MNEAELRGIIEGVIRDVLANQGSKSSPCNLSPVKSSDPIPVELSARHAHLSEKDAIALFGAPLTPVRELSQPGQFLCKERVRLIGPKGVLDNVAVLGPSRSKSQVEISMTDARSLGISAPVKQSGDILGSPGIILSSGNNLVCLSEGLIVAARHIHMSPSDAQKYGLVDKDVVSVRLESRRPIILEDVLVRVNEAFRLAMHIDSDEGNGSAWDSSIKGIIIGKKSK